MVEHDHRRTERMKRRLDDAMVGNLQPPGTIVLYAGVVPPDDWGICDGATLARAAYPRLFELIGETFGAGDGETTFNLPDLDPPQDGIRYIIRLGAAIPPQTEKG